MLEMILSTYLSPLALVFYAVIYIIGVFVECSVCVEHNYKIHGSGFWMYTTHDTRELTTKDVWRSLAWPFRVLIYIVVTTIWNINEDVVQIPCLLVGYNYKKSGMYRFIEKYTNIY